MGKINVKFLSDTYMSSNFNFNANYCFYIFELLIFIHIFKLPIKFEHNSVIISRGRKRRSIAESILGQSNRIRPLLWVRYTIHIIY